VGIDLKITPLTSAYAAPTDRASQGGNASTSCVGAQADDVTSRCHHVSFRAIVGSGNRINLQARKLK